MDLRSEFLVFFVNDSSQNGYSMKFKLITPINSYTKDYFKQTITGSELNAFSDNVKEMLGNFNDEESEEHNKNHIIHFLSKIFTDYAINTKEKNDLVIYHGKKAADSEVAVIIETKKRFKKGKKGLIKNDEMISESNPNAKALWQLIYYYLKERHTNKQDNIKYLIATNGYEWYIFDEVWFEKNIFREPKLKKAYLELPQSGNDTKHFYGVVENFLNTKTEIPCTIVNLDSIFNKKPLDKKGVKPIYKLFAKDHLLKKVFANDSNLLDKGFYYELLYILGLEEKNDGGKKLIDRAIKSRCSGSLIENTIHQLRSSDKWKNIKSEGKNEEEQIFSIALELCINWLNRILFLKLLEGQLIRYQANAMAKKEDVAFLNIDTINNYDELNELFFEVLAVPVKKRDQSVKKDFRKIPYLNSSLFEPSDLEKRTIDVSNLKPRLEIRILGNTILRNGKKIKTGDLHTIEYLFMFLDAYDFSSDENEDDDDDKNKNDETKQDKPIITAAVLGLIFEKINGYKYGSFFTPSPITMYMSRECLRKAVVQKFNEIKNWSCETLNDVYNEIIRNKISIKEANEIINSLKICDPAVGSGHFLVSMLNELIVIKHELQILADKKFQLIGKYNIAIERDELVLKKHNDYYAYDYTNSESQRVQEILFNEKQTIIENCLFGVDINQKSVMICQLRLWIELLKNAYYIDGNLKELQTLPNIDINIKCGNSLISRFALNEDLGEVFRKQKYSRKVYLLLVEKYKNATNKNEKEEQRKLINDIKNNFRTTVFNNNPIQNTLNLKRGELSALDHIDLWGKRKLTDEQVELAKRRLSKEIDATKQQLDDYKNSIIYDDAFEWRFEFPEVLNDDGDFVGFDVVIGNPPYFSLARDRYNSYYAKRYKTFNTAGDIYCLFYELSNDILKHNGNLFFITSNKWLRATYGQNLRNYLLDYTNPSFLFDFSWYQVFESASVDTNILSFSKSSFTDNAQGVSAQKDFAIEKLDDYILKNTINIKLKHNEYWNIVPLGSQNLKGKIESIGKKLEEWDFKINRGIISGFNKAFRINSAQKDMLIKKNRKNAEIIVPLLRGTDIERYGYNFDNIYFINTYNGFIVTIKNPSANIQKQRDNTYLYKPEDSIKWFTAKRVEHSSGNQYRINRVVVQEDYPDIFEHLKQSEKELIKREDKGNHWTNLRNCAYADQFNKEKLVWAETMRVHKTGNRNFPRFGFDANAYLTDKSVFIGVGEHLKYLLAVLNSAMGKWLIMEYVTKLDTGGYMMQKVFLDKIPIVEADATTEAEVIKKVESIIAAKKINPVADTHALENDIDKIICGLYGLTKDERNIVMGKE